MFGRYRGAAFLAVWILADVSGAAAGTASLPPATVNPAQPEYAAPFLNPLSEGYICNSGGCLPVFHNPAPTPGFGTTSVSVTSPLLDPLGLLGGGAVDPVGASASLTSTILYSAKPNGLRSLYLTGTLSTIPFNGAIAQINAAAYLSYQFEIFGPSPTVQAQFFANGSTSASGDITYGNNVLAGFSVTGVFSDWAGSDGGELYPSSFSESGVYSVNTGEIYSAQLSGFISDASCGNCGGGTETLTAFVDPTIVLPNGYSIVLSPAAVPEPSVWVMLLVGFAGLGLAGYRRMGKETWARLSTSP